MLSILSTKCIITLFFRAIVLPLSCASLDLWGCRLSSKRGSFSHRGLILCSLLIRKFVHFFLTITWVVASFVCNEDDIIDKVYYFLEFLILRIPFKTYLIPLQCYIISLQQRYTRLFICLYSLTQRNIRLFVFFVYIYSHKDIHRYVTTP